MDRRGATFEPDRIGSVRRSGLTFADHGHFDRLADLAAELTGAPVALVSIVDDERQFFVGRHGAVADGARRSTFSRSPTVSSSDDPARSTTASTTWSGT